MRHQAPTTPPALPSSSRPTSLLSPSQAPTQRSAVSTLPPSPSSRPLAPSSQAPKSREDAEKKTADLLLKPRRLPAAMNSASSRSPRTIQPVYPDLRPPAHPLAQRLCQALHALPAEKKKKCCNHRYTGFLGTNECQRMLQSALHQGGLQMDAQAAELCIKEVEDAHQGCAWIGPWTPAIPKACLRIFRGSRALGAPCRSSLECSPPSYCEGLSPIRQGRCRLPKANGARCGAAPDPLAAYTRQDDAKRLHQECQGYCHRSRCRPQNPEGAACLADIQCQKGMYCDGQRCRSGEAAPPNAPCTGACTKGYRCIARQCQKPKEHGELCSSDLECLGACEKKNPTDPPRCAMQCVPRLLRQHALFPKRPIYPPPLR